MADPRHNPRPNPRPNPRRYSYRASDSSRRHQPYGFDEPGVESAPKLPGKVIAANTVDDVIDKIAADLVVHAENCIRTFGDFHLALSGGSTPQPLYERLMYDPNYRRLPWRRTHLWIVDERCVPFDHPQSNFKMIEETIVNHADIPREQVHPMFALSPTGDVEYENQLRETLAWREKGQDRLDFVLLGMGTDGHTASLFPHTDVLHESTRLVRFNTADHATPRERLTMTFPMINSARFIAVLVTGINKATTLRRIEAGNEAIDHLPIRGVSPLQGDLRWYLDATACAGE